MLVQGPTLCDAACIWITKYDGYTPPERFITHNNPLARSFETLIMLVQGPTLCDAACIWITKYDGYTPAKRFITPPTPSPMHLIVRNYTQLLRALPFGVRAVTVNELWQFLPSLERNNAMRTWLHRPTR